MLFIYLYVIIALDELVVIPSSWPQSDRKGWGGIVTGNVGKESVSYIEFFDHVSLHASIDSNAVCFITDGIQL